MASLLVAAVLLISAKVPLYSHHSSLVPSSRVQAKPMATLAGLALPLMICTPLLSWVRFSRSLRTLPGTLSRLRETVYLSTTRTSRTTALLA